MDVFFATPNFPRGNPPKLCPRYHPCLYPHPLVKFREVSLTTRKVIGTLMLILSPILTVRP